MGTLEKWTIRNGSVDECMFKSESANWTCDIMGSNDDLEVLTVWGKTKEECLSRAKKICKVNEMEAALKEIAEAKGTYSMDRLEHATNTIRDMVEIANTILKDLK